MKILFTICMAMLCFDCYAQLIKEYAASNGVTYHLKDTVRLGRGSGADGWFVYMVASTLNTSNTQRDWLKRKFTDGYVILKSIEVDKFKRAMFIVGGGAMYNFHINIEDAIQSHEIIPFNHNNELTSVADELLKLKQLLDNGAITKAEYDNQKKKILN